MGNCHDPSSGRTARGKRLAAMGAGVLLASAMAVASPALPGLHPGVASASGNPVTAVAVGDVYDMNDGASSTSITGDTWINSWASDGQSLVGWNDGTGFNSLQSNTAQRGIAQLVGNPNYNTSTFAGSNLTAGTLGDARDAFNQSNYCFGYHRGVYEQDGTLYDEVDNHCAAPSTYSSLIASTDGGANWTNQSGQQNTPPALTSGSTSMFASTANVGTDGDFVHYGQGQDVPGVDNAGTYDYIVMFYDLLARVPKSELSNLNGSDYQWFTGLSGGQPQWSSSESAAVAMQGLQTYTDNNTSAPISSGDIVYNFALQKYMLMGYGAYWPSAELPASWTNWGAGLPSYHVYTSDDVWGPWTDSGSFSLWGSTVWEYLLSNAYTSQDGQKMWVATSGGGQPGAFCGSSSCTSHQPWHYGFQYMPVYFSTGATSTYYANTATLTGTVTVASSYPGYNGPTGYATGWPATGSDSGSDAETFDISQDIDNGSASAGWHIIEIRYANPDHNANTMSVYVNGTKARVIKLAEQGSDDGSGSPAWTYASNIYYLPSGTSNTVQIRCDTGDTCDGVNIDSIQVSTEPTYDEGQSLDSTATASASSAASGGSASNAAKGYVDYRNEWTSTGTTGQWLTLSWSSPQLMNKVVLYDKADSSDQVTSGTLSFSDGSTVPVGKLQNDGEAGTVITFPNKYVTSVTFTVNSVSSSTADAGLGEMDVYDAPAVSQNLALGQTVNASSTYTGTTAANVVDGSFGTYWSAGSTFPQSICVDLGSPQSMGTIQWNTTDPVEARSTEYTITASNDSAACDPSKKSSGAWTSGNWTPLATHTSSNPGSASGYGYMADTVAGTYRYVQLTISGIQMHDTGDEWPSVAEFEVYPGAPATNLAINRPVNASSTYTGTSAVSAVDGSTDTYWSAGSTFPQSICVDLGSARALGSVNWDTTDPVEARSTEYTINGSNDASACDPSKMSNGSWTSGNWTSLAGHTSTNPGAASGYSYMTDTVTGSYRYVQLTINGIQMQDSGDEWPSIANFEVYAPAQTTSYLSTVALSMLGNNSISNNYNGSVGYQFTPGANITVTDLGRYYYPGDVADDGGNHPANSGSHTLSLYDASNTSSPLATATVQMQAGTEDANGFEYAHLSSPVALTAGHSYYLLSSETSGGDYWWGYPALPVLGATTGTVNNGVYDDTSFHIWPSLDYGPVGYGPVNFLYYPTPTAP